MKKVLAIVLSVAMLLSVLSVNIFAADGRDDVFSYDYQNREVTGYKSILEGEEMAGFVAAIQMEDAQIRLVYSVQVGADWMQISLQGNENTIIDGSTSGEDNDTRVSGDVAYMDCSVTEVGETHEFTISGADFLNNFTRKNDTVCEQTWDGRHKGDYYRGFVAENINNILINSAAKITLVSLTVDVPAKACEIDGTGYDSLENAIENAVDGDTIVLTSDCECESVVIPAGVTLELNGNTLTGDVTVSAGAGLTVAEGDTLDGNVTFDVADFDAFVADTKVTISGGEINGNFPSMEDLVALYEPTQYETAVNVGLYVGGPGNDAHSDVSITGPGEYTLTTTNPGESKDWVILKAVDGSNTTYNTGIAEGTKIVTTKMTINGTTDVIFKEGNTVETYAIGSNGVIEVIYHLFYGGPTDYITNMPDDLNTVTVNFTVDPDNYISDEELTTTIQNAVSVTGGKFSDSTDIQDYLSDGYTVDGSGNVIVAPTDPIAVINANGTTYYEDMETALANVQDGDTITLRNNVEVHKMVDITVSNVILDLGGNTLTASESFTYTDRTNLNDAHVVNISADNVKVCNGTVKATANNKHAINVYQVDGAVLESVTADHTDSTTGAPIVIGGSDVTVKGRLTTITGTNSWYAINVDSYAGMESNITFAQNSTVAFEGVSPLGIYIETNSTADTDDVTVTFDKNVSVIAPEGVSDFTAVATDENATNASVVNPGNAGLKDNGDGTYDVKTATTSSKNKITGCVYLNEDYHALIVNGRFIAQPHVDNGTGFCVACKGAINK